MKAYPRLIAEELQKRGHSTQILSSPNFFIRLSNKRVLCKWLGYIDQFIVFPLILKYKLYKLPQRTLIVISDQALGPWIPLVKHFPHVVHCHDFLALQGALGELPIHKVSYTGHLYQRLIRWGFTQGKAFISISENTRKQLHQYIRGSVNTSEVLHNPLRNNFYPLRYGQARPILEKCCPSLNGKPYFFHIGRNWYKNRLGVLNLWEKISQYDSNVSLVLVGKLEDSLEEWISARPLLKPNLIVLNAVDDQELRALYSGSKALLFPSHAEGFGWPILEAMACGCPVVTTNQAPMTEVGGDVAFYISPCPRENHEIEEWSIHEASRIWAWLDIPRQSRDEICLQGLKRSETFQTDQWACQLEEIYASILKNHFNKKQ